MDKKEERIKQIEQFASQCYEDGAMYSVFISGAILADNNPAQDVVNLNDVWHNAEEFPAEVGAILYRTTLGQFRTVCHGTSGEGIWKVFVKDYGVAQWAYISDVLPKGDNV